MHSAFQLTVEADRLLAMGSNLEEEDDIAAFMGQLDDWLNSCGSKLAGIRAVRTAALAREQMAKDEAERFKTYAGQAARLASRMDDLAYSLLVSSENLGEDPKHQFDAGGWVKVQTNRSKRVEVDCDPAELPDWAVKRSPVKSEIKRRLLAGTDVPGCSISEHASRKVRWSK